MDLDNPDDIHKTVTALEQCVKLICDWMVSQKLKLNPDKTELLVVRPKSCKKSVPDIQVHIENSAVVQSNCVRNLGVLFDETLTYAKHISSICQSGYFHLKNIKAVRKYLPPATLERLVHAFITSKLDFCNSLFFGLPDYQMSKLQKLQHHAARVITRTKITDHITPVLKDLHWLPVNARIIFKILTINHKYIYSGRPEYLDINIQHSSHVTRRTSTVTLMQPLSRHKSTGDRSYSVAAPTLSNSLPGDIRCIEDYVIFKQRLKTHLFLKAFNSLL